MAMVRRIGRVTSCHKVERSIQVARSAPSSRYKDLAYSSATCWIATLASTILEQHEDRLFLYISSCRSGIRCLCGPTIQGWRPKDSART